MMIKIFNDILKMYISSCDQAREVDYEISQIIACFKNLIFLKPEFNEDEKTSSFVEYVELANYYLTRKDFFLSCENYKKAFSLKPDLYQDHRENFLKALKGYLNVDYDQPTDEKRESLSCLTSLKAFQNTSKPKSNKLPINIDICQAEYYLTKNEYFQAMELFKRAFRAEPSLYKLYKQQYLLACDNYKKILGG